MVAGFQHTKPPEMLRPYKSHIAIQSIVRFYLTANVTLLGQGQEFPGSWFKELKEKFTQVYKSSGEILFKS